MLEVLIGQLGSAGGPVLIALFGLSVAATAVTIFKVMQFRRMGAGRLRGARRAVAMWLAGERSRAVEQAAKDVSPVSAAVAAAMSSLQRHPGDRTRAQEIATQTALDQITEMSRHLRFIEAVVQAAPMLGLLGTVMGMISAFGELSSGGGAIEPAALAEGIWAALLTTAAGLAIAIPFYFVWTWLDARVEEERATMEAAIGAVLFGEARGEQSQPAATEQAGASRLRPARS
jgi:biopolymer transport protein ExbB